VIGTPNLAKASGPGMKAFGSFRWPSVLCIDASSFPIGRSLVAQILLSQN
jgi:hypothetical protein